MSLCARLFALLVVTASPQTFALSLREPLRECPCRGESALALVEIESISGPRVVARVTTAAELSSGNERWAVRPIVGETVELPRKDRDVVGMRLIIAPHDGHRTHEFAPGAGITCENVAPPLVLTSEEFASLASMPWGDCESQMRERGFVPSFEDVDEGCATAGAAGLLSLSVVALVRRSRRSTRSA